MIEKYKHVLFVYCSCSMTGVFLESSRIKSEVQESICTSAILGFVVYLHYKGCCAIIIFYYYIMPQCFGGRRENGVTI